ncbi:MAG: HAD family hydrolase [Tepidisphaeraceae bacterium]
MTRPAVFFDRDNTLIVNDGYLGDPSRVQLMPGAPEAVARVRKLGFATVVVSNQSGVGRGMFTEDDVRAVNARTDRMLLDANPEALVERHEYCPEHPTATVEKYCRESERRKPNPGMLLDAAKAMRLDLSTSWLVGDAPRDIEAGHRAGCRTVLLRDPILSQMESEATKEEMKVQPDYVASSLTDAIDFIEMHTTEAGNGDRSMPNATSETPVQTTHDALTDAIVQTAADMPAPQLPHAAQAEARRPMDPQTVMLERILDEIRRSNDPPQDFSIAKVLAGVVQGLALAAAFAALIQKDNVTTFLMLMSLAIFLETMTAALLLMGK